LNIGNQLQILLGMRNVTTMEIQAYMMNMINPATSTTIQKVSTILLNDWGFDVNLFFQTLSKIKF